MILKIHVYNSKKWLIYRKFLMRILQNVNVLHPLLIQIWKWIHLVWRLCNGSCDAWILYTRLKGTYNSYIFHLLLFTWKTFLFSMWYVHTRQCSKHPKTQQIYATNMFFSYNMRIWITVNFTSHKINSGHCLIKTFYRIYRFQTN